MTYSELKDFIDNRMRMSHVYQPVMLAALLRNAGRCSEEEISRSLLGHDRSQVEYYEKITRDMVGRVLRRHGIVTSDRGSKTYQLVGFDSLTPAEIKDLVARCELKLGHFLENRGSRIFDHRRKSSGYISGTLRYEVLKAARFRCELCGISADEKALEVDHILPRNRGGSDDLTNLQALCYSCNAMKRDRDDTDFREVRRSYDERDDDCPFCAIEPSRVTHENELAYAVRDAFPVVKGHVLVIPKRHTPSYFGLGRPEVNACNQLLQSLREELTAGDDSVLGFNVGVNDGEAAGQTVLHCHIHLIPRRTEDVAEPRGGVRNVIPGKGAY